MTSEGRRRERPLFGAPLRIAHRGGNALKRLVEAERANVDVVELDLWLHRGRLDVRHAKSTGALPLLRDGWSLRPGRAGRLQLANILDSAQPGTRLMLDLKGSDANLPRAAMNLMAERRPGEPYVVSSREWDLLAPFRSLPHVLAVYSCGSTGSLAQALDIARRDGLPAVGAHRRRLSPQGVAELREHVPECFAWGVDDRHRARELIEWGVTGIISDNYEMLRNLGRSARRGQAAVG